MNLPDQLSENAKKIYRILSEKNASMELSDILMAYAPMPPDEEQYKAISTADSLVVKGILAVEKMPPADGQEAKVFYNFKTEHPDSMPVEEADATEQYAKKTELNAEEQSMISIFKKWGNRLADTTLFGLYERRFTTPGDTEAGGVKDEHDELQGILKELTEAGLITQDADGGTISIKK